MAATQAPSGHRVLELINEFRRPYLIGTLFLAANIGLACTLPWLLRRAVQALQDAGGGDVTGVPPAVRDTAFLILGLSVLMAGMRIGSRLYFLGTSRRVAHLLRTRAMDRLVDLAPSFFARFTTGDIIARLTSDTTVCQGVCGPGLLYAINGVFIYIGCLAFMLALDPGLTALILIPYPFLILGAALAAQKVKLHSRLGQEAMGRLTTRAQEALTGMMVVKGFVMEERERQRFMTENTELLDHSMGQVLSRGIIILLVGLTSGVASLILLWVGGNAVAERRMSFADFVAFFGYMGLLIQPTVYFGWVLSLFARAAPALHRVLEIAEADERLPEAEDPHEGPVRGALELDRLSVIYPGDDERRPALVEVSARLEPGQVLGLFGRVGSGKSTVLRAIPRLVSCEPGAIKVDGVAIEEWSTRALRAGIGVVPQDGFLFSMSLADNIALGRPEASRQELLDAVEAAGLSQDLDQFPQGLDTILGERGITLSGGQRQRVAIARALLMKPRILLLDDALSMVDAETAAAILERLKSWLEGVTVVLAAHRTATLLRADEIIVLEQGAIVERGAPDELLARPDGAFAEAHERQKLEEQLERA